MPNWQSSSLLSDITKKQTFTRLSQGRSESIDKAKECFEHLSQPTENGYMAMGVFISSSNFLSFMKTNLRLLLTLLVNAYGLNGMGHQAVALYHRIPSKFINEIIHTSVLNACSHAGLVNEARAIFESINTKTEKIFNIMVNKHDEG